MKNLETAAAVDAKKEDFKALSSEIENLIRKFISDSEQKGHATFDQKLPNGWHLDMCYDKFIYYTITHYDANRVLRISQTNYYRSIDKVANVIAYAITSCCSKDDLDNFCDYAAPYYLGNEHVDFTWKRGVTI